MHRKGAKLQIVALLVVVDVSRVQLEKFSDIKLSEKKLSIEKDASRLVTSPVAGFVLEHSKVLSGRLENRLGVFPNNVID